MGVLADSQMSQLSEEWDKMHVIWVHLIKYVNLWYVEGRSASGWPPWPCSIISISFNFVFLFTMCTNNEKIVHIPTPPPPRTDTLRYYDKGGISHFWIEKKNYDISIRGKYFISVSKKLTTLPGPLFNFFPHFASFY